jgi:type IV pilus assembly protein PilV
MFIYSSKEKQQGVLLLEVLVSMLIFSIALLGLVALQGRAAQLSGDSEDRSRAALLAGDLVSAMWGVGTTDKADSALSGVISDWESRVQGSLPPYDNTVTATVGDQDATGAVEIKITWKSPGNGAVTRSYSTQIIMCKSELITAAQTVAKCDL